MKKAARKDFGYMRSPKLTKAGQMLMLYKCIHSCKLRRQDTPHSLVKSAARLEVNIQNAMLMTVSQLRKAVTRRRKELWAIQKDCEQRRSNWIATLAEDRARAAGDQDWERKMNTMKKRVDESQINRKLTAITKGQHSQLDLIQIPTGEWYYSEQGNEIFHYDKGVWEAYPCKDKESHLYYTHHTLKVITEDATPISVTKYPEHIRIDTFHDKPTTIWKDITSAEEVETYLLLRNKRHLQQADIEGGVSSSNIMRKIRSEHGLSEFNERILRGEKVEEMDATPEILDWLEAIAVPPNVDNPPVTGLITRQEYQDMFKNARERTSSGGEANYTVWKALAEQEDFAEFLCIMMSLPFLYGFANDRWCNEIDVMLEKKPGIRKIHMLRIIGLLHADFNTALKFLFAKQMMQNAENLGLSDEQWGSRKNRSSIDAAMLKLLMFETARIKKATLAGTFYDLVANYDRIFPSISNFIARRSSVNQTVLKARALVIERMRRRVKTGLGTSERSYGQDPDDPEVGGEVQGKGDVPSLWCVQSDTLLRTHSKGAYGMCLNNPVKTRQIKRCNTQFVDDNDGWASAPFDCDHPHQETVRRMRHDAQRWNNINNIPGQTVAFHKCKWQILAWKAINGEMEIHHSTEDTLVLKDNKGGAAVIEFLEPDQPNKGLGYLLCPNAETKSTSTTHYIPLLKIYARKLSGHSYLRKKHVKHCSNDFTLSWTMAYTHHTSQRKSVTT